MIKKNVVFLPIGDNQCGDAIAIRVWDSENPSNQNIILIDGGYKEDWKKVQHLVKEKFKASKIDLVVSTHLDGDHIAGLVGVMENIPVDRLWMHLPWEHSGDFLASRQEEFNSLSVTNWLKNSLSNSNDLALAAEAAGITPEEPFAGKQFTTELITLTVLGPTSSYYSELLPQILDKSVAKAAAAPAPPNRSLVDELSKVLGGLKEIGENILESHHIELLKDEGDTTPSNNSSTIMLLEIPEESKKLLFTGDAGKQALAYAYEEYVAGGHITGELDFVQVPHHGSRRNVGPTILNKFLGERTPSKDDRRGTAFVSAVKNCTKHGHPKKIATNAFRRRGYPVFQSGDNGVKHGHELDGYSSPAVPLPLFTEVEPDE